MVDPFNQPDMEPQPASQSEMVPQVPISGPDGWIQQPMVPAPDSVNDKIFEKTKPLGATLTDMAMSAAHSAYQTYSDIASPQLGLSDETQDNLRKAGWFNDFSKGEVDWKKSVAEGLIKPAAAGLDALVRGPYAAIAAGVGGIGGFFNPNSDVEKTSAEAQEATGFMFLVSGLAEDGMPFPKNPAEQAIKPQMTEGGTIAAKIETPSLTVPITAETPVSNMAGNINLNRIAAPEDVKGIIRQLANYVGDDNAFMAQRRGVISHAQTLSDADGLLVTQQMANGVPDWMSNWPVGKSPNAEQAVAARTVLANTATESLRLQKVAEASGAEEDMQAWREGTAQHILAQRTVAGMAAEAGRGLGSFGITVPGGEAAEVLNKLNIQGMTEDQIFKTMSGMDNAQNMTKFVNDMDKPSFGDMSLFYVFNNYLSGPITHGAYAASFAVQSLLRAGIETPIAGLVGRLQNLAGKTLSAKEIGALQKEHGELTDRIAKAESTQGRPMSVAKREVMKERIAQINNQFSKSITVMPGETAARFHGMAEGFLDAVNASWKALKTGDMQWLPHEAEQAGQQIGRNPIVQFGRAVENPVWSKIVTGIGQYVGAPSRVVGAIHSFQKIFSYSESLNALCYRQAASEGLEGMALSDRIAILKNDPSTQIMEAATSEAKYAALMGDPGKAGANFEKWANSNNYTKALVPFSRVMNNINTQVLLERTPIGFFSKKVRGDILGNNGAAAQATAIGKLATGLTVLGGSVVLTAKGFMHGEKPEDKKEAAFEYLSGNPPYSARIGNMNVGLRFFGGSGRLAALGADFHDAFQAGYDEGDMTAALGAAAHSVGHNVLEESGFRGIAELYRAVNDKAYGKRYAMNAIASAAVPDSVGLNQVNTFLTDPYMRQTRDFIETVKSRVPGFSNTLVPRIDIFGNPLQRSGDHSWADKDPLMQSLGNLGVYPSPVGERLSNIKLSEEQYADYAIKAGKLFYLDASRKVTDPSWVKMSETDQTEMLWASLDDARDKAKGYMRLKYPELAKKSAKQSLKLANPDAEE